MLDTRRRRTSSFENCERKDEIRNLRAKNIYSIWLCWLAPLAMRSKDKKNVAGTLLLRGLAAVAFLSVGCGKQAQPTVVEVPKSALTQSCVVEKDPKREEERLGEFPSCEKSQDVALTQIPMSESLDRTASEVPKATAE